MNNIKKDIFIKHFFLTIGKFKIFDLPITTTLLSSCSGRMYGYLEISFFRILFITQTYIKKCVLITQLFFNNELRERALNKIRIHYHHKTLLNYIYRWLKA